MKTAAVFFDDPGYNDYPFDDDYYVAAYHELAGLMHRKGGQLLIVRDQKTYLGGNDFSRYWAFDGTTFQPHEERVTVGMIYDKGYFVGDKGARLLNDAEMNDICTDKFKTYGLFSDLSPRTVVVHDEGELERELEKFGGIVVAKIPDSEGGEGVFIDTPDIIRKSIPSYPYLLQEFIDTSKGIPGLTNGMHDLRMVGVNGEIVTAYVRVPGEGKKISNISMGGSQVDIGVAAVPEGARALFSEVDRRFSKYPRRVYSADVALNSDGVWKIIEINSKPGLTRTEHGPDHARFHDLLSDLLLS